MTGLEPWARVAIAVSALGFATFGVAYYRRQNRGGANGKCRLGGAIADGVLLNWMLPDDAARAREWVREGAAQRGRPAPVVASDSVACVTRTSSGSRTSAIAVQDT